MHVISMFSAGGADSCADAHLNLDTTHWLPGTDYQAASVW